MNEEKYQIKISNEVVAKELSMQNAMIFMEKLFEEHYNNVVVEKMSLDCEMCADENK